jgi:DNA-binding transcriptional LysR family regulator
VLSHAHPEVQGELDREPYRSIRIGEDTLIAVSAPDAEGRPRYLLTRPDISTVPVLLYTDESGLGRIMRSLIRQKLDALAGQVAFTAHLASLLRAMALEGRGVAWLPLTLVADDMEQGRLVRAANDGWSVPLEIRLYRDVDLIGKTANEFWKVAADE